MKSVLKYLVLVCIGFSFASLNAVKHWAAPKTGEEVAAHRIYVLSLINNPYVRAFADMTAACEGTNNPTGL